MISVHPLFLRLTLMGGLFCCLLMFMPVTEAQFNAGIGNDAPLSVSPRFPGPQSTATVSLSSTAAPSGGTVRWFVNGVEQADVRNERSIPLAIGDIGENTSVRVVVSGGSAPLSATRVIEPAAVDLIIEADTVVPPFYKGRSLPAPETPVRITAVPHIEGVSDPEKLIYQWETDGAVLFGGPITGKQRVLLSVPQFGDPVVSVTIHDSGGVALARQSTVLNSTRPELYFYKENPLRSTSRTAVVEGFDLNEEEITVRAEPYFVSPDVFSTMWEHGWTLDGASVETNDPNPRLVTFRQTGGRGDAKVGFELTNTQSLLQSARSSFVLSFDGAVTNTQ